MPDPATAPAGETTIYRYRCLRVNDRTPCTFITITKPPRETLKDLRRSGANLEPPAALRGMKYPDLNHLEWVALAEWSWDIAEICDPSLDVERAARRDRAKLRKLKKPEGEINDLKAFGGRCARAARDPTGRNWMTEVAKLIAE